MSDFERISRDEIPDPQAGRVADFQDALDAALADPTLAVKLAGITQRQRNRLVSITSVTAKTAGKYAGKIYATAVRLADGTYDVYLTAVAQAGPVTVVPSATSFGEHLSGHTD